MARSRTDELLEGWKMVAHDAQRPVEAPRPRSSRSSGPIGLLAAGAVVVLLIVALSLRGASQGPQPSQPPVGATPSAAASASPTTNPSAPTSAAPTSSPAVSPSSSASPASAAASIVDAYTSDLVKGDYAAAWTLLAPDGPSGDLSFADWSSERAQFFKSVAGRYTIAVSPSDVGPLASWLASPWSSSIDLDHALVVEVTYPALAGNNAGASVYIVNPTATGLQIYDVR
jgi:hypothetical protein